MKKYLIILLFLLVSCNVVTPTVKPVTLEPPTNTPIFVTITPSKTLIPTVINTITPTITSTSTITPTIKPSATAPTFTPLPNLTVIPSPTRISYPCYEGVCLMYFYTSKGLFSLNEDIDFYFKVWNTNLYDKKYSCFGAVIKDQISQCSWGDDILYANQTIEWHDHINRDRWNKTGDHLIYFAYCRDTLRNRCDNGIDENVFTFLGVGYKIQIIP